MINPKPNDLPTQPVIPPIKMKNPVSRRRVIVSVLLTMIITCLVTFASLLLFALMFGSQLSNMLWKTDLTQQALYGTAAAVQNAQIVVDMTSTVLSIQANDQQKLLDTLNQRELVMDGREADLGATEEAITASIYATQTASVLVNEQQRTQAAINYSETQSAINQQSTLIAIEATSTQLALDNPSQPTAIPIEKRPFDVNGETQFVPYSVINCNWQGLAGTIYDAPSTPTSRTTLQVRVLGDEVDKIVTVGDNLGLDEAYNWAIQVDDTAIDAIYFLRLEDANGVAISPMVRVTFEASCNKNLAVVNFTQIQSSGN